MTLLFIIGVILGYIPTWLYIKAKKKEEAIFRSTGYGHRVLKDKFLLANCLYGVSALILTICFLHVIAINSDQVRDISQIERIDKEAAGLGEYKEQLKLNITTTLKRYPEYEKEMLSGFDPKLLILNFPVLKSNETIMREFEAYDAADIAQKELLKERLKFETNIAFRQRNHAGYMTWTLFNKQ